MVKIVQMLCPQRHCLLGTAYEEEAATFVQACDMIEQMCGPKGPFKRQCMICGSRDLHFEEGTMKFKTLEEAAPYIGEVQAANIATRMELDAQGKTIEKML